jgi:ABC-type nickel/cobalt efflux system permease component RcnA
MVALVLALLAFPAGAHPLGNFSVNRWAAIVAAPGVLEVDYVVDYAEIPAFQESEGLDRDGDGDESTSELDDFARAQGEALARGLTLTLDGAPRPLLLRERRVAFAPGVGGLRTLRVELRLESPLERLPAGGLAVAFEDQNFPGRAGWREIVARATTGIRIATASVPSQDRSAALTAYPADPLALPPAVAKADLRLVAGVEVADGSGHGGAVLRGSTPPAVDRAGSDASWIALFDRARVQGGIGVCVAAFVGALFWGAAHALSPGHGKTLVAAYLVGDRGRASHAVWLGLIVTVTHTAGVFALGIVTLLLSRWLLPETLYPWLSFGSGLTIAGVGIVLLRRRWRDAEQQHGHEHDLPHDHAHSDTHPDTHAHSHGHGHGHVHAAPERLDPRGLVALGVAGGIVPCPSALVVLLSALAFHQVLLGLGLILAFSAGLAAVLVATGLLMVRARSAFEKLELDGVWLTRMGVASALAVLALGLALALESLPPPLEGLLQLLAATPGTAGIGTLGLGLAFGVKHAAEADHVAAVSAIVSEERGLHRALWTGGLWGAGHTLAILVAGLVVLGLEMVIPERLAHGLELGVAVMIVFLAGGALARSLGETSASHAHSQWPARAHRKSLKPLLVGAMHGLAGSAALTLLVLSQVPSRSLGLLYLLCFGVGSIGGMALMSVAIGIPFAATGTAPRLQRGIRVLASCFGLCFGMFYAWAQLS